MNAAERLWSAVQARDWNRARAQFNPQAQVSWPHSGEQLNVDEYVAALRARPADRAVDVLRVVGDGKQIAVEAVVGDARLAAFYDLHDGHIHGAIEYWIGGVG